MIKSKKNKRNKRIRQRSQKEIVVKVERSPTESYLTLVLVFFIMLLCGVIMYMIIGTENNATGAVIGTTAEVIEVKREQYISDIEIELLLNKSAEIVEEMREEGLPTLYAEDLLIEMQDEANDYNINYNKLLENAQHIAQAREDALYVRDVLIMKSEEISDYEEISGFDASAAWTLYNLAKEEFENERYQNAKDILGEITPALDKITVDQTRLQTRIFAQTNRLWEWVKDNAVAITVTLLVMALIVALSYKRMQFILLRRRINHLMIEEEVLSGLMKKAQKEYYQDKKITKSMYAMKMEMYTLRIEEIKAMLPVLQKELQKKKRERLEAVGVEAEEKGTMLPLQTERKEATKEMQILPAIEKKAIMQTKMVKRNVKKKIVKKKEQNKEVTKEVKKKEQKKKRVKKKKKEPTSQKAKTASPKEIAETLASLEEEFGEQKTEEAKKEDKESKGKTEHKPLTEFF